MNNDQKYLAIDNGQPMQPSSGDSIEGVMTSILIAANIVCTISN